MLCFECQIIFTIPARRWGQDNCNWSSDCKRLTNLSAILQSAQKCISCRASIRGLGSVVFSDGDNDTLEAHYILSQGDPNNNHGLLSLSIGFTPQATRQRLVIVYMIIEQIRPVGNGLLARVSSPSTSSNEALRFVKDCLETCKSTHQICRKSITVPMWYPTRLIEILDEGNARLIVSEETCPRGPYASLSHRWGSADIFKCTNDIVNDLKTRVPVSALPVTFQNALHTIKYLGINYIWIDSLCIIQDSIEDWTREAQTMMKVYQEALINLAATRSQRSDMGLFVSRDVDLMNSEVFQIDNGVVKGDFFAVEAALDRGYWDLEIETAPLNTRGWVMQERLLSPRVAHFGSEQIFWDCPELTASETVPSGKKIWPRVVTTLVGRKNDTNLLKDPGRKDQAVGQWATIVNAYSKCQLTFNSDKFTAISGLAEYLGGPLNDKYCCGLWRPHIEIQLCWYVSRGHTRPWKRNDIAPSWSWVSIDGSVEMPQPQGYEDYYFALLSTVTDVHTQRKFSSGGKELYSGRIEMRCFLNPVSLEGGSNDARLTGHGMQHCTGFHLDTEDVLGAEELYFVPVFEVQDPLRRETKNKYTEITGVLLRLVDKVSGTYARCGQVGIGLNSDPETGEFAQSLLDLLSAYGKSNLPCWNFDDRSGHLINIL